MAKYVDAFAEWDDRSGILGLWRVFLTPAEPEDGEEPEGDESAGFLEPAHEGDPTMVRLYRAAFASCPRDFAGQLVGEPIGWQGKAGRAAAERVAKAVKKELERIAKGEPGPTDEQLRQAAQVAQALGPRRGSRRGGG